MSRINHVVGKVGEPGSIQNRSLSGGREKCSIVGDEKLFL